MDTNVEPESAEDRALRPPPLLCDSPSQLLEAPPPWLSEPRPLTLEATPLTLETPPLTLEAPPPQLSTVPLLFGSLTLPPSSRSTPFFRDGWSSPALHDLLFQESTQPVSSPRCFPTITGHVLEFCPAPVSKPPGL